MLISKYKKSQIIITVFAALFIILLLILANFNKRGLTEKNILGISLLSLIVILMITSFFYNSPIITFNEDFIIIKKYFKITQYTWNQVIKVSLSSKQFYSALFIFSQPAEAMRLDFDDGKFLNIWSMMYQNMDKMRLLVTQKLNSKLNFIKPVNINLNKIFIDKTYSGNVFLSFNTLIIIGMIVFFSLSIKVKPDKKLLLLMPVFFIILLYIGFGTQMNFFEVTDDKLIIKNHFFPWKRKEYLLSEIEEVNTETPYKRSKALRVITNSFQSKLYSGGSLREHNWQELLDDMSSIGIKISSD